MKPPGTAKAFTTGSSTTERGASVVTAVTSEAIGTTGTTSYTVTVVVTPPSSLPVTVSPVTVVGRAIR